jgi:SAM-dependent methyltransferase
MPQDHGDIGHVYEYYSSERSTERGGESLYEIWERGGAFNDSITPSVYAPEYRSHIMNKMLMLTDAESVVLSLGCGNAFVEGDLVARGRRVIGVDVLEEAVQLAKAKGVDAFVADFFELEPRHFHDVDLVFGDGILGHLFDVEQGLEPALAKLASLEISPGTWLVFSNDPPREGGVPFAPHAAVPGFWFVSREYLQTSLSNFGFEPLETYYFPYLRPISGMRNRTICVARVPE